jgi:hypothetical protein
MAATAGPSLLSRVLTVAAVFGAGALGGLIGWAVADLQCAGDCDVQTGIGTFVGAVLAALGTALICVLAVQAMAEWKAQEGRRRSGY